jgi:hypothetical protein
MAVFNSASPWTWRLFPTSDVFFTVFLWNFHCRGLSPPWLSLCLGPFF